MVTKRLYWENPYDTAFDAVITRVGFREGDPFMVLDRTLFHPEAGGQPADLGSIQLISGYPDAFEVTAVLEDGDEVVHVLSVASAPRALWPTLRGRSVRGTIDWAHRFDMMQQHTGQHILSRAFEKSLGAETVGFHLGRGYGTIDLDIQKVSPEALADVERLANQVVFQDDPIVVKEYEAAGLPGDIRSRFAIDAPKIRVVYIGDYDACPCGGTHVSSAGQIGLIRVNGVERAHGGVRVVFRCGWRALADYRHKESLLAESARLVSQGLDAVPGAISDMKDKILELEKTVSVMNEILLDREIAEMVRQHADRPPEILIECLQGKEIGDLRVLAKRVSEGIGSPVVFFTVSPNFQAIVVCPFGGPDARTIVSEIAGVLGGRGGGTPQLAQLGSKEPLGLCEREAVEAIQMCLRDKGILDR